MTSQAPTPSATSDQSRSVPGETCPRCHTTEPWGHDSWCPNCGFYPSVDSDGINDDSWQDQIPVEEEPVPEGNLFASLPAWFWIMMGGAASILVAGLGVRTQAAQQESLRGTIALSTLGIGFTAIGVAHLLALIYAMKHDRRVRLTDAMVAWFTIWQPTITQLPASRGRVWSLSWGVTSLITAVLIIGGIDYNAPFRTDGPTQTKSHGNKAIQAVTGAAKAAGQQNPADNMKQALGQLSDPNMMSESGGAGSMKDAVNGLTGTPEELAGLTADEQEAANEAMLCVVYGMLMDDQETPAGFLFAGKADSRYQHIAAINAEDLPARDYKRLATRLSRRIRNDSAIPSSLDAVWVDPVLVCRIRYVRQNEDGTVLGPEFESIVREGSHRSAGRPSGRR